MDSVSAANAADSTAHLSNTTAAHLANTASAANLAGAASAATLSRRPMGQDPPRMRSSIACWRCRRSKVKCLNNGVNTPCRACTTSNRDCVYPSPVAGGEKSVRRDGGDRMEGLDTPRSARAKPKKTILFGTGAASIRPLLDALDPSVLTAQVWLELFEIWQLHFAGDLSFLHPPTFQNLARQTKPVTVSRDFATPPRAHSAANDSGSLNHREHSNQGLPAISQEFLLAFLALTSKFHGTLVAHHSPSSTSRPSNPLLAAEYYAAACRERLSRASTSLKVVDLARCQAYLMLAVHEWGNMQGYQAWADLGTAIRYARLLGLQYADTVAESGALKSWAVQAIGETGAASTSSFTEEALIESESRRRTLWSGFVLERTMASGIFRPADLSASTIGVQLPCSERAFLFGEKVITKLFIETIDVPPPAAGEKNSLPVYSPLHFLGRSRERSEDVADEIGIREPATSRYIRALATLNRITQYAASGGRLTEEHPPWDTQSKWHGLYKAVQQNEKLPRDLTLSPGNISAHHSTRTLSSYLLLHTTILLSKLLLHREWLPFTGIRPNAPTGPLDLESPFMAKNAPDNLGQFRVGFWRESAVELFESAKTLLGLLAQCAEYQSLVETPLVGFATYMVALLGLYSTHFPWMDPNEAMFTSPTNSTGLSGRASLWNERDAVQTRRALDLLRERFSPRLRQAAEWLQVLKRLHKYYLSTKRELKRNYRNYNPFGADETFKGPKTLMPLRMGEEGYNMLDSAFGGDVEMVDAPPVTEDVSGLSGTPTSTHGAHLGLAAESAPRERWAAVNIGGSGGPVLQSFTLPPMQNQQQTVSPNPDTPTTATSSTHAGATSTAETHVNWTTEQVEAYLDGLETVFGASDLVGFMEGRGWREMITEGARDWRGMI